MNWKCKLFGHKLRHYHYRGFVVIICERGGDHYKVIYKNGWKI